jgi:hypothetical protein
VSELFTFWGGVDLFFCVFGFVIMRSLCVARDRMATSGGSRSGQCRRHTQLDRHACSGATLQSKWKFQRVLKALCFMLSHFLFQVDLPPDGRLSRTTRVACFINPKGSRVVLCEVNFNGYDGQRFCIQVS